MADFGLEGLARPTWGRTPFWLRWLGKPAFRCWSIKFRRWIYTDVPIPIGGINREPCPFWHTVRR